MSEEPLLVWRIVVEGHVQGVGYRHFARRIALRFGVSGWVRNRRDGAVEMLVAGPADKIEAALAELRRGPLGRACARLQDRFDQRDGAPDRLRDPRHTLERGARLGP